MILVKRKSYNGLLNINNKSSAFESEIHPLHKLCSQTGTALRNEELLRSPCPSKAILGDCNQAIKKGIASPTGIYCLPFFNLQLDILFCDDCVFSWKNNVQFNNFIRRILEMGDAI